MSQNTPPIRPPDREEQERVKLPPIEANKRLKENFDESQEKEGESHLYVLTWFFSLLKKLFHLFIFDKESPHIPRNLKDIFIDLKALRKTLVELTETDHSTDALFIKKLSTQWMRLAQDSQNFQTSDENIHQLRSLKESLDSYRGGADHSFSYYLEHHAGQNWYPIPFLEMLSALHEEALNNPMHCTLRNWIHLIDEIVS